MVDGRAELYVGMTNEEVARLVLSLLLEEMLKERLAEYRNFADFPEQKESGCALLQQPLSSLLVQ